MLLSTHGTTDSPCPLYAGTVAARRSCDAQPKASENILRTSWGCSCRAGGGGCEWAAFCKLCRWPFCPTFHEENTFLGVYYCWHFT